ncbi:MAG: flagellar biosynthetic protein FliR [Planctomycetota bacterium]
MAPIYDQLLPHLPMFAAVMSRLVGLFLTTPILTSPVLPVQVKALLVVSLAAVLYPTIDHSGYAETPMTLWTIAPLIAGELLIGIVIGLLVLIPTSCIQLAGLIIGQQLGLALAEQFNPALDISGNNFGQLLFTVTMASFIFVGGIEFLFVALAFSFESLPLGGLDPSRAPLDLLVGVVSSGFVLAVRVALPVLAVIGLETIAMGFIMKTVPTLNIMNVGFPLRILVGIATFTASLGAMKHAIMVELHDVMLLIESWVLSLGEGAAHG